MDKLLDGKLELHSFFNDTISDISDRNIVLPFNPTSEEFDMSFFTFPPDGKLVTNVEEIKKYRLDAKNGEKFKDLFTIYSYDESILKYSALQGDAYITSHSIIRLGEKDYIPSCLITLYFYTRSEMIKSDSKAIIHTSDSKTESKKNYFNDKIYFLKRIIKPKSLVFIDGPLIGGDYYVKMIQSIKDFIDMDTILVFFVKNSNSNLVTDNIEEFRSKFNSDMHWSYSMLMPGERTNFFKYVDRKNSDNAKVFCYIKSFNTSPQRVEFPLNIFIKYRSQIDTIMDMIYYLMIVQGDLKNPQIRPIAIAEKYARSTLQLIDLNRLMRSSLLVPTMNQERFGW